MREAVCGGVVIKLTVKKIKISIKIFAVIIIIAVLPYYFSTYGKTNEYDIYALSYGNSEYREDIIYEDGDPNNKIEIEWMFWVVKGSGRIMLVDTGFDDESAAKNLQFSYYIHPVERLKQLNVRPSDITDVIITHTHWDHIGCLEYYSNAVLWIQEKEYKYLISGSKKGNRSGITAVQVLSKALDEGRLRILEGSRRIIPGIRVCLDGAHTPGHQHVRINTVQGTVIIAGDAAYTHHNLYEDRPIGLAVDRDAAAAVLRDMKKHVDTVDFILPGHSSLVMDKFPVVSEGIVHVISKEKR